MIPTPAGAIGLGVSPGNLELSAPPGGKDAKILHVINQSGSSSRFEVYAEGPHTDWLTISPAEFSLNAGGIQEVQIALKSPLTTRPASHRLTICVVTMSADSELRFGAGVKVPANVHVITNAPLMPLNWWLIIGAVILPAIVAVCVTRRWRSRY